MSLPTQRDAQLAWVRFEFAAANGLGFVSPAQGQHSGEGARPGEKGKPDAARNGDIGDHTEYEGGRLGGGLGVAVAEEPQATAIIAASTTRE